ncbi:hypothetical protein W97_08808 [Coniosporium apollinis CBS 100218]|uniref:Uncharacterized protein n=1 Tax=Coniosporium apollinis (strain CBS 100218) TaxID=1168221 RepID=R7Z610_CONA1|nr:uncharacterized protein W97_08808 [Coniosporium apollinis CBS 100218]EON69548.1 hypothetical protein W97_08808 [Coniosporium apollinis CBS 100218]
MSATRIYSNTSVQFHSATKTVSDNEDLSATGTISDDEELSATETAVDEEPIDEETVADEETVVDDENVIDEETVVDKESADEEEIVDEQEIVDEEENVDEEETVVDEESVVDEETAVGDEDLSAAETGSGDESLSATETVSDSSDASRSTGAAASSEVARKSKRNLNRSPPKDAQDPALFLHLIEAEANRSTLFNLNHVIDQLAAKNGVNLSKTPAEGIPPAPGLSSTAPTKADKQARRARGRWAQLAQDKGLKAYEEAWSGYVKTLTKAVNKVDVAKQPKLCPAIISSVIDTCKRGVRTQVAYCKKAVRDRAAQCKIDVDRSVKKCKKKYPIVASLCDIGKLKKPTTCEGIRIDLPFCEVDRLTATCCEGAREPAKAVCSVGLSTAEIQKQVQSVQAKCSIGTGLIKAAMKSYLSGQALGFITQLQSIKEIGDTVQIIKDVDSKRKQYAEWADGLTALAQGRGEDAKKLLGSLASEIAPAVSKGVEWAEAAQAVVEKNVDGFLAKVASAAGEIESVKSALKNIETLKTVANDMTAIQAAAKKCVTVPGRIMPEKYLGWQNVTSAKEVDAAVAKYKKSFAVPLYAAAECQAVVIRAGRVLNIK